MPIPLVVAGGSAALSALGGRGKQSSGAARQTTKKKGLEEFGETTDRAGRTTLAGTDVTDELTEALEAPEFAQFRRSLLPTLQREISRAGRPVFGPAQTAGFLGNLNDLASASMENIKQSLAGAGALDSGRLAQAATDVELGRAGEASSFFSQLPFLEEQTRSERLGNILGLSTQFAGRAPISQRRTGTATTERAGTTEETGTRAGTRTATEEGETAGTTETRGPSFLSGLLSNLGGLGGIATGRAVQQGVFDSIFNPKRRRGPVPNIFGQVGGTLL